MLYGAIVHHSGPPDLWFGSLPDANTYTHLAEIPEVSGGIFSQLGFSFCSKALHNATQWLQSLQYSAVSTFSKLMTGSGYCLTFGPATKVRFKLWPRT